MRSQAKPIKNIRRPNIPLTKQKKVVTERFMTDSEEDEFDDTLLAKIDELLALSTLKPTKQPPVIKSAEDRYFDEIVDMLNETDRDSFCKIKPVVVEDDDTFDADDFFDQILKEIPKSELDKLPPTDKKTSTEIKVAIETIEEELQKFDQSHALQKSVGDQHALDQQHIANHLAHATTLIKQLTAWSPAKNQYNKILQDKKISQYDKLQQIIDLAHNITIKEAASKKGFLLTHLTSKASKIHANIARIDINAGSTPTLEVGHKNIKVSSGK